MVTLAPEEFEPIFWHEAGLLRRRSFVICNSFSRSPEMPNKFRVIMPFKSPALSIDEFQAVHDAIVERLAEDGFDKSKSGLDPQCRSGVQPFYIPCTNRQFPE